MRDGSKRCPLVKKILGKSRSSVEKSRHLDWLLINIAVILGGTAIFSGAKDLRLFLNELQTHPAAIDWVTWEPDLPPSESPPLGLSPLESPPWELLPA